MNELVERRARALGPNVPTFYRDPVEIVRGEGCWLWDASGNRYLDCYNNVPHVGHCHPYVVEAIANQAATLNTHTRYLHRGIVDYVDRLTATFDGPHQAIMVCSGSEANDIALRMAQAVTGKRGFIATDATYHGNTTAVSQLSRRRPPIGGYPDHVRLVPAPTTLTPLGGSMAAQGEAFAEGVRQAIQELEENESGFAGIMLCPIFANEGLPDLPDDFLMPMARVVTEAGGLLIADEVQPGFGRTGRGMWSHSWLGITPDVITLGKPMGNGHPVAACVARPGVMTAFREAFGYFNTFGGNPVSMAAASAVMDVIEDEDLINHASRMSAKVLDMLGGLDFRAEAHIRGRGQFYAVELTRDGLPAPELGAWLIEGLKDRGVLMGVIGPHRNILKFRPPMPFCEDHLDHLATILEQALKTCPT
ncbi:MAG: aspartate aminotransferase family protein [Rhodobacteraceae bacterium]|nr:aspartate aminotransferase family protein [Paracoccaceae bacterium]